MYRNPIHGLVWFSYMVHALIPVHGPCADFHTWPPERTSGISTACGHRVDSSLLVPEFGWSRNSVVGHDSSVWEDRVSRQEVAALVEDGPEEVEV